MMAPGITALSQVSDLFFPRSCTVCGGPPDPGFRYLCWDCASTANLLCDPMCSRCGEPVAGRVDHQFVCHLCSSGCRYFERARSAARYDGPVREMIRVFKYESGLWLRFDLAILLEACLEAHEDGVDPDCIVPVPLHPARRRRRGYNQADVLARCLADRCGIRAESRVLKRVRFTPSQTNLTARERADNVRGAFLTRRMERIRGRHVLLVDDVMTTGATVSECSRCLLKGGAASVRVVTVARG